MNKIEQSKFSLLYMMLTIGFCICLIVANLVEIKTVDLGPLTITAGVLVFPLSYIINDCIVEVYGFARARLMIWIGFAASLFVTLMLQLAIALPGSADWTAQEAMVAVYGGVPRIVFASFVAFICGSMVNAVTMSKMKRHDGAGRRFKLRAIVSTIYGESLDSAIFFPLAFAGNLPWDVIISLIVSQAVIKTLYETAVLPVTSRVVRLLRRLEGGDVTDENVSYSWV